MALSKIRICAKQLRAGAGADFLELFLRRPLADFATEIVEYEVSTGISRLEFPWGEVLNKQISKIDFGKWRASGVGLDKCSMISAELAKNPNLRAFTLEDDSGIPRVLTLSDGWPSKRIAWSEEVVKQSPILVAVIIKNCVHLEDIDLR